MWVRFVLRVYVKRVPSVYIGIENFSTDYVVYGPATLSSRDLSYSPPVSTPFYLSISIFISGARWCLYHRSLVFFSLSSLSVYAFGSCSTQCRIITFYIYMKTIFCLGTFHRTTIRDAFRASFTTASKNVCHSSGSVLNAIFLRFILLRSHHVLSVSTASLSKSTDHS